MNEMDAQENTKLANGMTMANFTDLMNFDVEVFDNV